MVVVGRDDRERFVCTLPSFLKYIGINGILSQRQRSGFALCKIGKYSRTGDLLL